MKPTVLRQRNLVQLTYPLPHRVFTSKVYPLRSLNGSSVIVYGHEDGLRIVWYGGKSFKPPRAPEQSPKVNGTNKSDPMVIDLDDNEPEPSRQESQPLEFEDEEDEIDPSHPYQNVMRYLDVSFGTSVLHVATPQVPPDSGKVSADSFPPMLSDFIVLVASCEDLSIRLVTLPLTPPSPLATDPKTWNIQTIRIAGSSSHQDQITSLSITHTEMLDTDADGDRSKSRSRSRTRPTTTIASKEWSLLVASTSCTGNGLLLIHQIPILDNHVLASSSEVMFPVQRQYLSASLFNAVVAFNPSAYPADRHSNVLVTIPDAGCVKIYQVFSTHSYQLGRRGSAATTESTTSSLRSNLGSSSRGGRLLVTLYSSFSNAKESEWSPRRKLVLDASWVLGGRAILALFEDGEWGVWDLEAAGPSSASTTQNLVQGQGNVSGIQGGSLTKFAIKGSIGPDLETGSKATSMNAPTSKTTGLAPLTPHTKKLRSDGMFQGNSGQKAPPDNPLGVSPCGSISVTEHPSSVATTTMIQEESLILSFRSINVFIPSLLAYWRSETTGKGTFESVSSIRPNVLLVARLGGEHQHSISEISQSSTTNGSGLFGATQTTPNLLIATDSRIVILAPPLSESLSNIDSATRILPTRPLNQRATSTDQMLLTQGELDVDGMDRILQGMVTTGKPAATSTFDKSVGFLIDEDNDVEMGMGTPTPKTQHGRGVNRLVPSSATKSRGRIFS